LSSNGEKRPFDSPPLRRKGFELERLVVAGDEIEVSAALEYDQVRESVVGGHDHGIEGIAREAIGVNHTLASRRA